MCEGVHVHAAVLPARLSISFSCSRLTASSSPSSISSASGFWATTDWLRKVFLDLTPSSSSSSSVPVCFSLNTSHYVAKHLTRKNVTHLQSFTSRTIFLQGFERYISVSGSKGISYKPSSPPQVVLPVVQTPEVMQLTKNQKKRRVKAWQCRYNNSFTAETNVSV